jgi:hypothetical protein
MCHIYHYFNEPNLFICTDIQSIKSKRLAISCFQPLEGDLGIALDFDSLRRESCVWSNPRVSEPKSAIVHHTI